MDRGDHIRQIGNMNGVIAHISRNNGAVSSAEFGNCDSDIESSLNQAAIAQYAARVKSRPGLCRQCQQEHQHSHQHRSGQEQACELEFVPG
jgi:hypothetical protein